MLGALLFSFLLWFSISMSEKYAYQVAAPLVIHSVPEGKALSSPLPREVRLRFYDTGWRLAKLAWSPGMEWVIDLANAPNRPLTVGDIAEQLSQKLGVQPVSMIPESLHISLDAIITKRVRVLPVFDAVYRSGYGAVGKPVVIPETVTVTGAQQIVQLIQEWPTVRQTFADVRQPIAVSIPLADTIQSLVFSPRSVRLQIDVQAIVEKSFTGIPIELVSLPKNREVLLSAPTVDIVLRGGIEQLAAIRHSTLKAIIDYRTILEDTSGMLQPEILLDSSVQIVKRTPERVQYVLRKKL